MESIEDVLHHLIRSAHFRSEADRQKAHEIVTASAESETEPTTEPEPEAKTE